MRLLAATAVLRLLLALVCLGSASSYANNPPQGRLVASFSYNAEGLRIEKRGERGIERYTYDDQSVLSQRDGNNALVARYTYGPNRLISLKHKTEGTQFYLTDALNSIVDLMTTDGLVQARYQYDAFGNKRSESGSSWNRFAFTGYEEDKETNLLYAKARYYDADTGRFLSQDAWQGDNNMPPSLHKYLYAYQNPTVWVDPTGNVPVLDEAGQYMQDTADRLVNQTANTDSKMAAVGLGVLAGANTVVGGVVESVNFGLNLVASKGVLGEGAKERAGHELDQAFGSAQLILEDPKGFAQKASTAVVDTAQAAAGGDPKAIAQSTSFAMSFLTAKPNANVGAAAQKATQIVGNAAQGTGNVARTVATNFVKAVNEPRLGPLARQVGAVGSDIKPNEIVRSSLGRIVPETASTATSSYSQLRASALFLKNEAGVVDASYRRQVIESFGADLRVGEYAGQAYQYSGFYGTASRYLTPAPLTNPIQSLALPPANSATLLQQYNIAATRALIGTAAPQNFGAPLTGGAQQIFIPSRSVLNSTLNLPRN